MKPKGLIEAIVSARGWQRWPIAFASGALSALAMAPFDAWPILFLTFPTLVWLIDGAACGRWRGVVVAASTGWWFGFGYFVAGLYWIGYAFLVDARTFGWMLPFAVIGLPAVLALYTGLAVALARMLWTRGAARLLALGAALTATEWLRGHLLSGFPWNTFGYALASPLALAQAASVIGIWGLTFIAIVVFASPAALADDRAETRRPWLPLVLGIVALGALDGWGALRLHRTPTRLVANVHLRVMQPNLRQGLRFNYAARKEVMDRYIALSSQVAGAQATAPRDAALLIWPESPFPFILTHEPAALAQIVRLLSPRTVLITGATRLPEHFDPADPHAYNSMYVIDHDGSIVALYDKVHLVPFGEYLPFERALERLGFEELTKQRGGFLPGDQRQLIRIPGVPPALPLICYEIVFPGAVAPPGDRAGWMINLTNDGWFGISTGPYQHFQQARMRAIEEGLPLVRAANTGISAVVDPLGRIINSLPLGKEGVLNSSLPRSIGRTIYARFGDSSVAILVVIALLAALRRRVAGFDMPTHYAKRRES